MLDYDTTLRHSRATSPPTALSLSVTPDTIGQAPIGRPFFVHYARYYRALNHHVMPTITIYPWMLHDLHLQGAALLVFALWFTDRQDRTPRQLAHILCFSEFCIRKVMPQVRLAQQSCITTQQSCITTQQSCQQSCETQQSCKEKEKNQKRKENPPKGNIPSSSSLSIEGFIEKIFDWFFADADYLKRLCDMFEIPCAETGDKQKIKEGLEPYVKSFARFLRMKKTDLETKGAEDTKEHFTKWMQKGNYQRIYRALERAAEKQAKAALNSPPKVGGTAKQIVRTSEERIPAGGGSMSRYSNSSTLTPAQLAEQKQQKDSRMNDSDALQRHLDEIQRAAQESTAEAAKKAFFAKHCKKSNKTTNK